jgi:LysM repeat protein
MSTKKITFVVVALTLLLVVPVAGCRRAKPTVAVSDVQSTPAATAAAATGRTVVPITSPSPTSEGAPQTTPTPSPQAATPTPYTQATHTPTTAPISTPVSTTAPTTAPTSTPASTATPTTVPTKAPSGPTTHIVQPGENLFRIALHYGMTYQTVAAANGIVNPDVIAVGQSLVIPAEGTTPTTTTRTHVVQPGENLFRIALKYGVTVEALAVANGIGNVNLIYPGQSLVIP